MMAMAIAAMAIAFLSEVGYVHLVRRRRRTNPSGQDHGCRPRHRKRMVRRRRPPHHPGRRHQAAPGHIGCTCEGGHHHEERRHRFRFGIGRRQHIGIRGGNGVGGTGGEFGDDTVILEGETLAAVAARVGRTGDELQRTNQFGTNGRPAFGSSDLVVVPCVENWPRNTTFYELIGITLDRLQAVNNVDLATIQAGDQVGVCQSWFE